mmetsp:Transcript_11805/g.31870  ORF Transcript_11805/g.31870 Transcript_11805/m.31870 type:complete len:114 (+) Transcript_11805:286-627(+)
MLRPSSVLETPSGVRRPSQILLRGLQKTVVTFSLPEGSDPVVMNWERHDDGQEQFVFRLAPGVSLSYHTHVGFSWVARRDDDNSVVGRWTMAAGLASGANRIVVQSGRRSAEL